MRQRHPRNTVFSSGDSAEKSPLGRETQVEFHYSDCRITKYIDLELINVNGTTSNSVESILIDTFDYFDLGNLIRREPIGTKCTQVDFGNCPVRFRCYVCVNPRLCV